MTETAALVASLRDVAERLYATPAREILALCASYEAEMHEIGRLSVHLNICRATRNGLHIEVASLRADRDALAELLRRAGEVVKPFAEVAKRFRVPDQTIVWGYDGEEVNAGSFRAAAALLADIEAKLPRDSATKEK